MSCEVRDSYCVGRPGLGADASGPNRGAPRTGLGAPRNNIGGSGLGSAASKQCPGVPGPSPGRELSVSLGRVGLHRKRNSLLLSGSGPEAAEFIFRVSGHGLEALGPTGDAVHTGVTSLPT